MKLRELVAVLVVAASLACSSPEPPAHAAGDQGTRVSDAGVGEPDAEVISLGEEIGASMIVVGSRGGGRLRRPIGSVSSSIAAHAHCPVLVVRE